MQGVRGPLGEKEGVARRQMRKAGFTVHREGLSRRQDALCVCCQSSSWLLGGARIGGAGGGNQESHGARAKEWERGSKGWKYF